jgi:hypothetical protein
MIVSSLWMIGRPPLVRRHGGYLFTHQKGVRRMALLTTVAATSTGATPTAPAQITVWASGDTINASDVGDRGVVAVVANTSGGSLDFRVEDPGFTPASNAAANGYTTVTVPNSATRWVYIGPRNVNGTTNTVKVGASTSNAAFTVTVLRY